VDPDGRDELFHQFLEVERGQRLHREDMAQCGEAHQLCGHQRRERRCPHGLLAGDPVQARHEGRLELVAERLGRRLVRQVGRVDGDQRGAGRLVLPMGEERPGVRFPPFSTRTSRLLRLLRQRFEKGGHVDPGGNGLSEEAVLVAEEVVDQRRIHVRPLGDSAHRRARIALDGEEIEGSREDLGPGGALSGAAAAAP
jgi:hypothetical protein